MLSAAARVVAQGWAAPSDNSMAAIAGSGYRCVPEQVHRHVQKHFGERLTASRVDEPAYRELIDDHSGGERPVTAGCACRTASSKYPFR